MRKAPLFCTAMAMLLLLCAAQVFSPDQEMSLMENRMLTKRPTLTLSAMSRSKWANSFEAFCADQMPLRTQFVTLYTAAEAATGRRNIENIIVGKDGFLFERSVGWSERNVRLNAEALEELSQATGKRALLLAVPTAASVYPENVPAFAPMADEEAMLAFAGEQAEVIPLLASMRAAREKGNLLYYRTDHHWTAAGVRVGYLSACEALRLSPKEDWPLADQSGFLGSFYARCPLPWQKTDVFSYPETEGLRLIADGQEMDGLVDQGVLRQRDWYASLLYGNHGMIEIINDQVEDGALFVLKDSYANALLPSLARHYHRIQAVDPRYFAGDIVEAVNQNEGDVVLCVYGIASLASGRTLALLEGL